ncbi:MAG: glycosyltransferase family 2 protein [Chitinophagaceae bacterium]|nr:MAG: glycosyltransferase family 2 protein [Chitinophagaceae bacterium]
MNHPLVSVCIPAYNAEKYIGQALDSILAQSYPYLEIVVVNDGSEDGTAGILNEYQKKGVVVVHQDNQGQCAAANIAFHHSRGEYVKFFDADDILSKDFIAGQVMRLDGKDGMIASGAWGRFYGDDLSTFRLQHEKVYQDLLPMDWLIASMENGTYMMQCGLWLIPRKVLSKSGLWDERLSLVNDFDFFIRVILASKKVLFTENAVLYYRSGVGGSLSGLKSERAMASAFLSTELGVNSILRYEDSVRTRKICADAFQHWIYEFYPSHKELYLEAKKRVAALGGSQVSFPSGGYTKLMTRLLGWKRTKVLKSYFFHL